MRQTILINSFVVTAQVARIRVGNVSFVPRPDPELAPDWRAVVFFTRGPLAKFELIDRRGRAIDQTGAQASVPTVPVTTVNPRHLPPAVCSLGASDLPRVASQWEVVADRAPTRGRTAPPDALFSCARGWYAVPIAHAVYSAAILLDAQNPARTAPNLPGLTPSTHPGDYEEASSAGGHITATRVGNAWLLVQGPNQRQRTALLNTTSRWSDSLRLALTLVRKVCFTLRTKAIEGTGSCKEQPTTDRSTSMMATMRWTPAKRRHCWLRARETRSASSTRVPLF
jgi:hypothetical protein